MLSNSTYSCGCVRDCQPRDGVCSSVTYCKCNLKHNWWLDLSNGRNPFEFNDILQNNKRKCGNQVHGKWTYFIASPLKRVRAFQDFWKFQLREKQIVKSSTITELRWSDSIFVKIKREKNLFQYLNSGGQILFFTKIKLGKNLHITCNYLNLSAKSE